MIPDTTVQKLLSVLSVEQVGLLADALSRAHGRAVERRCNQSIEVVFNEKGFPRHIGASDWVIMPAPGKYQPE